ncbi:MAG: hypothetical protein LBC64_11530 [Fibromonadaceae bacterium]|jgi:uncharacterized protein (TIGR02145 family)|nr:hypothetical protein [Fibromonadaceae bacterium]
MRTNSRFLLAASLVLALALTFGCSDNGGDTINGNGQGGNNHQVVADLTITTAEQLIEFASLVNRGNYFKDKIVRLGANIMLNDTTNWQNWANNPPDNEWTSMGSYSGLEDCFNGTFDGNGYVISGIYINSQMPREGLFKCLGGTIKNLGVIASYIKSENDNVGGLVGLNYFGTISNTYFIGVVRGGGYVGGLVGYNWGNIYAGAISNSYSIGVVEGYSGVGGLVGNIAGGSIKNSYSAVEVTTRGEGGGLVGSDIVSGDREITGSYYDKEKSGKSDTGKGVGKTTMEMKQQSTFVGWDFNGTWGINSKINNGYPYLQVSKQEIGNNLSSSGGILPSSSSVVSSSSSEVASSSSSMLNSSSDSTQANIVYGADVTYQGETYKTIKIGTQTWFQRNLNYVVEGSKCGNGSSLSDANTATCDTYGRLYNWATAMNLPASCNSSSCATSISAKHQGICPSGWHIPSDADWDALTTAVGGFKIAGKYLKATNGWNGVDNGEDKFGFAALPGGGYSYSYANYDVGYYGSWWSASEDYSDIAYSWRMSYDSEYAGWDQNYKNDLFSVRCLKDDNSSNGTLSSSSSATLNFSSSATLSSSSSFKLSSSSSAGCKPITSDACKNAIFGEFPNCGTRASSRCCEDLGSCQGCTEPIFTNGYSYFRCL